MKKKFTLIAAGIILSFLTMAQPAFNPVAKGNKQAGLQMMLNSSDMFYTRTALVVNHEQKTIGLHLAGSYGWFLERGWMLGLQANMGVLSGDYFLKQPWGYNEKSFDFSIGPMTRYYFTIDKKHRFKPFVFAGAPIVYMSKTEEYTNVNSTDSDQHYLEVRGTLGAGAAYFGRKGSIELNASSMGFFLGVNKFIQGRKK
jgi:hypothetical protein